VRLGLFTPWPRQPPDSYSLTHFFVPQTFSRKVAGNFPLLVHDDRMSQTFATTQGSREQRSSLPAACWKRRKKNSRNLPQFWCIFRCFQEFSNKINMLPVNESINNLLSNR